MKNKNRTLGEVEFEKKRCRVIKTKDRVRRRDCFYRVGDSTVVPGTAVSFILSIAQVYAKAPGRHGDQTTW